MTTRMKIVWVVVALAVLTAAFVFLTTPTKTGGSVSGPISVGPEGKTVTEVSLWDWKHKYKVRTLHHRVSMTKITARTRTNVGPCYRVDAYTWGDSWAIDKVVRGYGHFKVCMKAGDHHALIDKYSYASSGHSESWFWDLQGIEVTKGAGWSTTWCLDPGEQGPCEPVEYRYWRFTFQWKQGVNIVGQDVAHHKTLYLGCTLRGEPGGYHCGSGEV